MISNVRKTERVKRRRRPKRVMAVFGIAVGLITISAPFALDACPVLRFPYLVKLTTAYANLETPTVVALGSSRTGGSFNIALMTAFLNEQMPSRGLTPFNAAVG